MIHRLLGGMYHPSRLDSGLLTGLKACTSNVCHIPDYPVAIRYIIHLLQFKMGDQFSPLVSHSIYHTFPNLNPSFPQLNGSKWKPNRMQTIPNKTGITLLVGGWALPPLKNHGVKVSWGVSSQLFLESHNPAMFQTTNQNIIWYFMDI